MNLDKVAKIKLHNGNFESHMEKVQARRLPPPKKGAPWSLKFKYLMYRTLPYHRKYGWLPDYGELEYMEVWHYFRHGLFGGLHDWGFVYRFQPRWSEDPTTRIRRFIINVIPHWVAFRLGWWDTDELIGCYDEIWWHNTGYDAVMPIEYYMRKPNWEEYDQRGLDYTIDRTYLNNRLLCWIADRMFPLD